MCFGAWGGYSPTSEARKRHVPFPRVLQVCINTCPACRLLIACKAGVLIIWKNSGSTHLEYRPHKMDDFFQTVFHIGFQKGTDNVIMNIVFRMFLPKRIHTKEEDRKAIIFDLDGTLWSSVDLMLGVWKSGFSKIQLPHVPLTREIVCSCMGLSTEETGKRLFPGASPEAANAAMQILFEEELLVLRDKSTMTRGTTAGATSCAAARSATATTASRRAPPGSRCSTCSSARASKTSSAS